MLQNPTNEGRIIVPCELKANIQAHTFGHCNSAQINSLPWLPSERLEFLSGLQVPKRLSTHCTTRDSKPGWVEIFRVRPNRPWILPSFLYNGIKAAVG